MHGFKQTCARAALLVIATFAFANLAAATENTWTAASSLNVAREIHTAMLLPSGQVLVAGGTSSRTGPTLASAELFSTAPVPTTTTLSSSQNPSTMGQGLTFTATVTGQAPTGTVAFKDGATALCNAVMSGATATCLVGILSVGTHAITATYSGDGNNASSMSAVLSQVVNKAATTTALVSNHNPSTFGQSVTFTATVTGPPPTGTITFNEGATVLCNAVSMLGISATCNISTLSVATHSVTATYSGDGFNATSTSAALSQIVGKAATTTGLSTACMTTFVGGVSQPFTLTAVVSGNSSTGSVTFNNGLTTLCSGVALISASASCNVTTLDVTGADKQDVYNLTASYGGDANNTSSVSDSLAVTVLGAGDVILRNGFEATPSACPVE